MADGGLTCRWGAGCPGAGGWLFSLSRHPPRTQVDSTRYYEACVSDACACDSGGDRECFCTAVAAYAQACHEAGVCVSWRTPDICRESGSVHGGGMRCGCTSSGA